MYSIKTQKVSIIIPTYNNSKDIEKCLIKLSSQTYKNIEIIISDGGSSDNTIDIVSKYTKKILNNTKKLAEPGVALGMENASGDLLMVITADNYFRDKTGIEKIVQIFKDPSIDAAFPKHVSDKNYSLISQYRNTFTDPLNHFIYGYASNGRTFHKIYKTISKSKTYDVYDFSSNPIKPIIAFAQGFTIKKDAIQGRKHEYDDITPIIELLESGKKIAYAHGVGLLHDRRDVLWNYIKKQRWAARNALNTKNYGINIRKQYLTPMQKLKIYIYIPYSLSLIFPIIQGVISWNRDKEKIWFFHPVITFITALAISIELLLKLINSSEKEVVRKK